MIDVIIPVYNGEKETIDCIESLLNIDNVVDFRIIAINDKSPSEIICNYLKQKSMMDEIILLENIENLGFVKSVNKGLRYSENDVIILNSDTVVFNNLIDILKKTAYKKKMIGTVTALTNSGTIVSLPKYNQDNCVPLETIVKIDCFLKENYKNQYEIIPTGVGHCMFIKQELLSVIGFFDEDRFEKGYGEENDFSLRAKKAGYDNVVSLETIVYHYGGTSFGKNKLELINDHKKILNKLYPLYRIEVRLFNLKNNKIKKICRELEGKKMNTYLGEKYEHKKR